MSEEDKEIEEFKKELDKAFPDRESMINFFKKGGFIDENGKFIDLMANIDHVPYTTPVNAQ